MRKKSLDTVMNCQIIPIHVKNTIPEIDFTTYFLHIDSIIGTLKKDCKKFDNHESVQAHLLKSIYNGSEKRLFTPNIFSINDEKGIYINLREIIRLYKEEGLCHIQLQSNFHKQESEIRFKLKGAMSKLKNKLNSYNDTYRQGFIKINKDNIVRRQSIIGTNNTYERIYIFSGQLDSRKYYVLNNSYTNKEELKEKLKTLTETLRLLEVRTKIFYTGLNKKETDILYLNPDQIDLIKIIDYNESGSKAYELYLNITFPTKREFKNQTSPATEHTKKITVTNKENQKRINEFLKIEEKEGYDKKDRMFIFLNKTHRLNIRHINKFKPRIEIKNGRKKYYINHPDVEEIEISREVEHYFK